jgi:hypothetical protein
MEIGEYEKDHKSIGKSGNAGDAKPKPNPVRPGRLHWRAGIGQQ